ncbi:PH domain-containing protein [Agilicoccus flavus]|uniref:PH domain-containing protein n=1 Tax=Agilicoccus flavus TaxID=2775968 RepID=UPI001CF652A7|nr:PH domain-containing protein [Agilicoccus flavus]
MSSDADQQVPAGSLEDELRPPESWPGAAGRRSVSPSSASAGSRPRGGDSWPGAAPSTTVPARKTTRADADGDPTLRPPAHRVAPQAVNLWRLSAGLGWLLPLVGVVGWTVVDDGHRTAQTAALLVVVVLALVHVIVMPLWRYRVHRWEVTPDAVYTQTGWWRQDRRIAPIARVQTVDSERGPLERLFGLGTVTVTTASAAGPLRIAALPQHQVDRLVADLTRVAARHRGDAT